MQSNIYGGVLGPDGFFYLSSINGLHRMEGQRIRNWFADPSTPGALPSGAIVALAADNEHIWLGNSSGLIQFSPKQNTFRRIPFTANFPNDPRVNSLQLVGSDLYIGTIGDGVYRINTQVTGEVTKLQWRAQAQGSSRDKTLLSMVDSANDPIIGLREGLAIVDASGFLADISFPDENLAPGRVSDMAFDEQGNMWAAKHNGLHRFDSLIPLKFTHFSANEYPQLPMGPLEAVDIDAQGTLWVANESGLSRWRQGDMNPTMCTRRSFDSMDRDVSVSFINTQLDSLLLVGTLGSHLRVAALNQTIRRIAATQFVEPDSTIRSVRSTLTDRQRRILIGTSAGLLRETAVNPRKW